MNTPTIPIPKLEGYVIWNPDNGKFSRGGYQPVKWTKNGKIWSQIGHLKNHIYLAIIATRYERKEFILRNDYKGCIVYDVATGQPANIDIYEIARKKVEKEISGYFKNYKIVEED